MEAKTQDATAVQKRGGAWTRRRALGGTFGALAALAGAGPLCAQHGGSRQYLLTTANTGGTYYPVGVALATVTKTRLEPEAGVSLTAISSAGSRENIQLLRRDEAQFAMLQGIHAVWAAAGEGPYVPDGPSTDLRSVCTLWPNIEHFILRRRFAETGTLSDVGRLTGRGFAIGKRNSGAEVSGLALMETIGVDLSPVRLTYQGYGPAADALINGTVDGVNIPAGLPVSSVTRAFAGRGRDLTLLSVSDEELARIEARYSVWRPFVVPAGTYPNLDRDVRSLAQPNVLAVRADIPDEDVYRITKTLYANLPLLASIHKATSAMALDNALEGLPLPLHPGAQRHFEEAGLTIPEALQAP